MRARRLQEHQKNLGGIQLCMRFVERYSGIIDRDLDIRPGDSAMLSYLAGASRFAFRIEFFNFDLIPSYKEKRNAQWATEVERTWLGRVQLCFDSDVGYCYIKQGNP